MTAPSSPTNPLRLAALVALSVQVVCSTAEAQNTVTLQVTAIGYRVIPHESTTYYRTPGYSDTNCYGSGTYFGNTLDATAHCSTVTTPPQVQPITVRSVEVYNQVEAAGMVYTIRCTANWVGSNCSWLVPRDVFPAEIQGTTMWMIVRKGGNLGKEARAKHQLLDVRPRPQTLANKSKPDEQAVALVKQTAPVCSPAVGEALDNASIIKMVKTGWKTDTLVWVIGLRPPAFSLSEDDKSSLKAAGVPASVISAMEERKACPESPSRASAIPPPPAVHVVPPAQTTRTITVRFTSMPSNAEVDVDGNYWGTTPTVDLTRLPPGTHTIAVKKIGYKPWERKIDLSAGDDRTVSAELEVDPTKPRISGLN